MTEFVHPEVLVSCDWVEQNRSQTDHIRIVESDEDILLYEQGHIAGAVKLDWTTDLQDAVVRDYVSKARFEELCVERGISNETIVVFYGDKNNWWGCYAYWVFKLFGHETCLIMNGGRKKWELDKRPMTREASKYPRGTYKAKEPNNSIRAFRDEVLAHMKARKPLVDVRSPGEYTGELLHMPDYPQEGALRAGHIPGAVNVPWSRACNDDGTFKSRDQLEQLYLVEQQLKPSDEVIAYCRIGERSSLTWYVLTYLLGFSKVKNYDGSWTEWGNLVGAPIEKTYAYKK
jgi:thiosulfate/3-mercaptopyruvate sulfurtransferase